MMVRNKTDRYHLAMEAFETAEEEGIIMVTEKDALIKKFEDKLAAHREYIIEHGDDPKEISEWVWEQHS